MLKRVQHDKMDIKCHSELVSESQRKFINCVCIKCLTELLRFLFIDPGIYPDFGNIEKLARTIAGIRT